MEEDLIYNFSLLIFHSSEYIYFPQEEKIFFDKVKEQSENIINKKNLSKDDLEFLEVFEKIILSLKFID